MLTEEYNSAFEEKKKLYDILHDEFNDLYNGYINAYKELDSISKKYKIEKDMMEHSNNHEKFIPDPPKSPLINNNNKSNKSIYIGIGLTVILLISGVIIYKYKK